MRFFHFSFYNLETCFWLLFIFNFVTEIPDNDYIKYFGPDYSLKIPGGHIVSGLSYSNICFS